MAETFRNWRFLAEVESEVTRRVGKTPKRKLHPMFKIALVHAVLKLLLRDAASPGLSEWRRSA